MSGNPPGSMSAPATSTLETPAGADGAATASAVAFINRYPDAAMITSRADGTAHMARIELSVVDGRIRTSGSPKLVRMRHVRRDPRCSLFVFGPAPHWLGLETRASILDGPDAPQLLLALMRSRHRDRTPPGMVLGHDYELGQDRLYPEQEYLDHVRAEQRFVFDFEIIRAYGNW
ncbi:MAG: hypothetical protein QOC75_1537 [Pseudonocardiales bacterium]|nr:hypothetical protein [Pseudonocardiales bacterium]